MPILVKKNVVLAVVILPLLMFGAALLDPTFRKIVFFNVPDIDDYKIFENRILKASASPFRFPANFDASRAPLTIMHRQREWRLGEFLEASDTIAFLVIKDDTLVYEKYFKGRNEGSLSMSLSVTKSLFSALVGAAVEDGHLASLDVPVTNYVPELLANGFQKVTLGNLLQMTSGMSYASHGIFTNPFGKHLRLSYTDDLKAELLEVHLGSQPGTTFLYKSVDYALLALALQRALSPMTITEYMQETFWTPLGMEFDGLWSVDRLPNGLERTWCCLSATARDLAKFGRLYLRSGNWQGTQILSAEWVRASTSFDTREGSPRNYQYGWWIMSPENGEYRAEGIKGQFVHVNPTKQTIIVRLGESLGGVSWDEWKDLLTGISAAVR